MSDLAFPTSIKPIVSRGYGQKRGGNIWRTNVQGGLPRQGRDTFYDAVPINITVMVANFKRLIFWSFIASIDNGAASFQMTLDTGNGLESHNVQITSDISETTQNGQYWTITFTATAERTSVQDLAEFGESIVPIYEFYGDDLPDFLAAYEDYCTTPMFINDLPGPS